MNKEIEVQIFDEIGDETIIKSKGKLNLETGAISEVVPETDCGFPNVSKHPEYNFSYGLLLLNGKELEFTLSIEKNAQYRIPTNEFSEVKEKAVKLLSSSTTKMKR